MKAVTARIRGRTSAEETGCTSETHAKMARPTAKRVLRMAAFIYQEGEFSMGYVLFRLGNGLVLWTIVQFLWTIVHFFAGNVQVQPGNGQVPDVSGQGTLGQRSGRRWKWSS